jgi:hypothetical protein
MIEEQKDDSGVSLPFGKQTVVGSTGYSVEQFPKNKNITNLSDEQKFIRQNQKKYVYKDKFTCVKCSKELPIQEFYVSDINTGRRKKSCRDCQMKAANVIEIGKLRFSAKILDKGFRRCSVCKDIKPLDAFKKNKNQHKGISNNCYDCANKLHKEFVDKQTEEIGLFYIKQYAISNYGNKNLTEKDIETYRQEIIKKRSFKYFLDGNSFVNVTDFANYIQNKYGILKATVLNRIHQGYSEQDCIISEGEARSKAYTKGSVKVTDTVTGEIFKFNNTANEKLNQMFSKSAITKGIKTGDKTRITGLSKYKNPCIITRI